MLTISGRNSGLHFFLFLQELTKSNLPLATVRIFFFNFLNHCFSPSPPPPPPLVFFFKEKVKPCFFVTLNIIIHHVFPENFVETSQVVPKIWRLSLSILAIFIDFIDLLVFFDISLLLRNLMASA